MNTIPDGSSNDASNQGGVQKIDPNPNKYAKLELPKPIYSNPGFTYPAPIPAAAAENSNTNQSNDPAMSKIDKYIRNYDALKLGQNPALLRSEKLDGVYSLTYSGLNDKNYTYGARLDSNGNPVV